MNKSTMLNKHCNKLWNATALFNILFTFSCDKNLSKEDFIIWWILKRCGYLPISFPPNQLILSNVNIWNFNYWIGKYLFTLLAFLTVTLYSVKLQKFTFLSKLFLIWILPEQGSDDRNVFGPLLLSDNIINGW